MTKDDLLKKLFGDEPEETAKELLRKAAEAAMEKEKPDLDFMKLWVRKYPDVEDLHPDAHIMTYTEDGVEYLCKVDSQNKGEPEIFVEMIEGGAEPVEIFRTGYLCCYLHTILAGTKATRKFIDMRKTSKPNPHSKWAN